MARMCMTGILNKSIQHCNFVTYLNITNLNSCDTGLLHDKQ